MLELVAFLAVQAQTTVLATHAPGEPVRIQCPVNQTTRIVLPEPLRQLKGVGGETSALGLIVERTKPQAILRVTPKSHPASGTVEFRGPTLVIRLSLESTASGVGSEVQVSLEAPPPSTVAAPPATAAPAAPVKDAPSPDARPQGAVSAPPAGPPSAGPSSVLDFAELLRATPVSIDRREGLPGQREMVLMDALRGDKWIWLRFKLEGGAAARVERVWWEHGDITSYTQEAEGKDLRVVVQVPRASVSRKTRVSLQVGGGPLYRFPLRPSTLPGLFRKIFE